MLLCTPNTVQNWLADSVLLFTTCLKDTAQISTSQSLVAKRLCGDVAGRYEDGHRVQNESGLKKIDTIFINTGLVQMLLKDPAQIHFQISLRAG